MKFILLLKPLLQLLPITLSMKATESTLNEFLATPKTRFVIPIYQRNYDWQDHQCSQLYSDICNVATGENRPSQFVGL